MATPRSKRQYVPLITTPPARSTRRAVLGRVAPLLLPLLLVNATAIWGQAGWAYERITDPNWPEVARLVLAMLFATTIESIGIFLAWEAHLAMMADQASAPLRAGSYAVGGVAGWINWDHWHSDSDNTRAATFAGLSAISPWLWSVWSRARNRARLAELNQSDSRGLKLSTSRKLWHPVRSLKLIRWAAWSGETRPSTAVATWEALTQPPTRPAVDPPAPATTTAPLKLERTRTSTTTGRASISMPAPDRALPSEPESGPEKVAPPAKTDTETITVRGRAAQRERAARATDDYVASLKVGRPLSAAELAGRYPPMSESWGRKVILKAPNVPTNGRVS